MNIGSSSRWRDGTLRGAQGLADEIAKRGLKIGIHRDPETIDNDISYVGTSFGFETAVASPGRPFTARTRKPWARGTPSGS